MQKTLNINLAELIGQLLVTHECVAVPGLGSFLVRDHVASWNRFNHIFRPAYRSIFFNDALQQDDGVLITALAGITESSYSEARNLLQAEIVALHKSFNEHRQFTFGALGNFFLNQDQRLFFIASQDVNFNTDTFGLQRVELKIPASSSNSSNLVKPLFSKQNKSATTETVVEDARILAVEAPIKSSGKHFWKIAAAFALMLLGTGGIYEINRRWGNHNPQQATMVQHDTFQKVEETEQFALQSTTEISERKASVATASESVNNDSASISFFREGEYWITGGLYLTETAAQIAMHGFQQSGLAARLFKPENSSLTRVLVGSASTENEAVQLKDLIQLQHAANYKVEKMRLPQ